MSNPHTTSDNPQYIDNKEHNPTFKMKNVFNYGYDGTNAVPVKVNSAVILGAA